MAARTRVARARKRQGTRKGRLLTAGAVAERYGVSKQTVINWHRQGMPGQRLEAWSRGFLVFDAGEVDEWVRAHKPWRAERGAKGRGRYWWSRYGYEAMRRREKECEEDAC